MKPRRFRIPRMALEHIIQPGGGLMCIDGAPKGTGIAPQVGWTRFKVEVPNEIDDQRRCYTGQYVVLPKDEEVLARLNSEAAGWSGDPVRAQLVAMNVAIYALKRCGLERTANRLHELSRAGVAGGL